MESNGVRKTDLRQADLAGDVMWFRYVSVSDGKFILPASGRWSRFVGKLREGVARWTGLVGVHNEGSAPGEVWQAKIRHHSNSDVAPWSCRSGTLKLPRFWFTGGEVSWILLGNVAEMCGQIPDFANWLSLWSRSSAIPRLHIRRNYQSIPSNEHRHIEQNSHE